MIIFAVLMLAAVLLICISSHKDNHLMVSRGLSEYLIRLKQSELRKLTGGSPMAERPVDGTMPPPEEEFDLGRETGIYTVLKHEETLSVYQMKGRKDLENEEILAAAEGILNGKNHSGTWQQYQYEITIWDNDLMIAFADISVFRERERIVALLSVLGALLLTGGWMLLAIRISGRLVLPLKEAYEKQSDFILAAEHELKTPLSVIKASLSMLRKNGVESKYLDYAEEETDNMTGLVGAMLELSELDLEITDSSGMGKRENAVFDLGSCVESAVLPFESAAYEKEIRLQIQTEKGMRVSGNEERIRQLAGILTDNALKHTHPGGMTEVSVTGLKNSARLFVRNQGDEIPAAEADKIFDRFYRIDKARNRSEGRYGLGLSIAWKIAQEHNTQIHVHSGGGWTEFSVLFALSDDENKSRIYKGILKEK